MTAAVKNTLRLVFLIAISLPLHAQPSTTGNAVQIAEEEAVRRQEKTILLHMKLDQAIAAQKRGDLVEAATLYQESVSFFPYVQVGNPAVDLEKRQALGGLDAVREKLAHQAMDRGDMTEALAQVDSALKFDPNNEALRNLKSEIAQKTADMQGMVPSQELVKTIPEIKQQKIDIATKVQNAKLLYEMGKYDEAEVILKQIMKADPSNKTAPYYLDLVKEAQFAATARKREAIAKASIGAVEKAWIPSSKAESLPVPNPMASTNLVYTSPGRQKIKSKLDRIRINTVNYKDLPLTEVLNQLRIESQKRDPEGTGINFMLNPHAEAANAAISPTDTTGAAAAGGAAVPPPTSGVDLSLFSIKIDPPLTDLSLAEVLDAITKVAVAQDPSVQGFTIKYTIEDYAVVFSPKPPDQSGLNLYTRVFKVDPNTFVQGLQNVTSINLNPGSQSSGTGGGGGGGGGTSGGSSGGTSGGTSSTGLEIPSVQISPVSQGGQSGSGGGIQGGGNRIGLDYVTKTNNTEDADALVKTYFTAAGVDLASPGKVVFFNDRLGELLVRATLSDLEIIQEAVELLNQAPPELTIEAKFVELTQEDSRALGFNWYLGNTLINNGAIGAQGGTAPSYQGPGTTANPSGIFPGPGSPNGNGTFTPGPGAISPSASDNNLTAGLRNQYTQGNTTGTIPTVATITGIMTDPQFRVAIQAIQQRSGADLMSAPKVTTLSGRQTHIAAQDLQYIVISPQIQQNSSSSTGLVGGTGVTAPSITYNTTPYGFGPVLDVMPTVSADGYSVQMALIPTILEFIGYDNPGAFIPQAEAAAGSTIGVPIVAVLPLPHFRVREVVTTCNVWDGQTVVLGGMISETITKIKDEIPVLGDLPLVGRLFQSESSDSQKQNLLIFVTPTIIDPAGNRVHNDEDMPFARSSIPTQPAVPAQ